MDTASDLWRRKLGHVFRLAEIEGGHPHRFRHTFAVELLKKGVPMEEVAILLGQQCADYGEALCFLGPGTPGYSPITCSKNLGHLWSHRGWES